MPEVFPEDEGREPTHAPEVAPPEPAASLEVVADLVAEIPSPEKVKGELSVSLEKLLEELRKVEHEFPQANAPLDRVIACVLKIWDQSQVGAAIEAMAREAKEIWDTGQAGVEENDADIA